MGLLNLSEEHEIFRTQVRNFIEKEIRPYTEEWERQQLTPRSVWKRLGEMGYLGITFPEEVGGMGADHQFSRIFSEELSGCGSSGACLGVFVQTHMATPALLNYGNDFLKETYLKKAISGEMICAIAVTEPGGGSDVASLRTKAIREGDDYILNGSKTFITNGMQADFLTLLARTSDDPGYGSYSLFVVPTDTEGVTRSKLEKTCYQASDTAEITLENVRISKDHLIGVEGKGFQQQMQQFQDERLVIGYMMAGTMRRAYELTKQYVKERSAFGKRLVDHQVTRHKLAHMYSEMTTIDALVHLCTEMADRGEDFTKEVSMLKLIGGEVQQRVLEECVQIHGGYGLMHEYEVARYFKDAKLGTIGGGSSEVMKEILSKMEGYQNDR